MRPIGGDGDFRPFDRLVFARGIGQHVAMTLVVFAGDEDAGLVGVLTRARSRINRDHNSRQIWRCRLPGCINDWVVP